MFFWSIFVVVGKHLHTKLQKISSNGLDFANFLNFWSILAVFWLKNGQKRPKSKKVFLQHFVLLRSIYIPHFRKFYKTVWIQQILFIFGQKTTPKYKKMFFVAFYFVGKHLYTKFQKISSNSLDFANFLHFLSILAVFSQLRFFGKSLAISRKMVQLT